jgi:hydroxymethylbilane synthase
MPDHGQGQAQMPCLRKRQGQTEGVGLRVCEQGQGRNDHVQIRGEFLLRRMQFIKLFHLPLIMKKTIKIGTRGSQLALWQANWVKSALVQHHPEIEVGIEIIKTTGDKILDVPLAKVGGKGLFVKEIEEALLNGRVDLAVHSMKDMPADVPEGLCIGAVPKRETPNDILISKNGKALCDLPAGARIGTSSLRRAAQILAIKPDFTIVPLRGNLDTRIKKLQSDQLDAIVLAAAGVKRLNLADKITQYLDVKLMIPAVGQGALCIEIRDNDPDIESLVSCLDHLETNRVVTAERAFLKRLEGGCQVPVAAHGEIKDSMLNLSGMVAELDGSAVIKHKVSGPVSQSEQIGINLAERLIDMGGGEILAKLKSGDLIL